ncbi:hypothetical protein DEM27_31775 [Metarhizobium album]|uniref:Uncharacterized protein n=1 Tax=Metarhizobium album TaxID=2182425 RepID=A0A2U2DGE8_9HYPH|nr:hypothetical protein [Rhizobium album]PWE52321.1 hypothetical protein DEM27_31775 [Rhizobium album]
MCVVSMVGDHFADKTRGPWAPYFPQPWEVDPAPARPRIPFNLKPDITRDEFDALKRDVQEMKELLKRAKKYDEDNHEPHCEVEEKMELLRAIAKLVGIDLSDVIGPSRELA